MKTAQQIIGLPVVSIFDGNEIGKVKNVIINASKGTIDFFVIDSGIRSLSGGVIPADRVLGIGEYALTIQQPDDISDIVKIPAAIELMQKNITVRGTRVLTKKGSLLGETGDFYVNDESTYSITGVEFIPADKSLPSGIIPRSSIITFGKDLLVVQDDVISQLIESPHSMEEEPSEQKKNSSIDQENIAQDEIVHSEVISQELSQEPLHEKIEETEETEAEKEELFNLDFMDSDISYEIPFESSEENSDQMGQEAGETAGEDVEEPQAEPETEPEEEPEPETPAEVPAEDKKEEKTLSAAELFEMRQRQYLVGKKVTKTIYAPDGQVLVNNGEIITNSLIDEVKAHGKLIELVMNYEE